MDPKYKPGDQVNHKSIPCKVNGQVLEVIYRTVYNLYRVKWCSCSGDYFENELEPVENSVLNEEVQNDDKT